MVAESQKLRG